MRFSYEPKRDAHDRKIKHEWKKDHAGFVPDRAGNTEGKCPASIDIEQAEALLNDGIPDSPPDWLKGHPKYFYNIHDGVIYKAVETNPGKSYHAYPCRGPRSRDMTARMQRRLLEKAQRENCLSAYKRGLRTTRNDPGHPRNRSEHSVGQ